MSFHQRITRKTNCGIGFVSEPERLSLIHDPSCAAAIWRRKPLTSFQNWIDAQASDKLPNVRMILPPERVTNALTNLVDLSGLSNCIERNLLVEDVSALAQIFANIMQVAYLRLRLQVVSSNACHKFHIDSLKARLICTYRGNGTQYGISENGTNPYEISDLPTGSVMIMRGTLWPENPMTGLLHRSPPIEGTGETRLVLVLDPIEDLDEELDENILH